MALKRFDQIVNIQPQSTRTYAENTIAPLVQRLEEFNAIQAQIVTTQLIPRLQQKAVERGEKSAGKYKFSINEMGITQPPEYKKERFIGGIEIKAHNKALRAAYVSSITSDIREGIELARSMAPADVNKFNELALTHAYAMLNESDPSIKGYVSAELDRQITNNRISVQAANIKKDNEKAKLQLEIDTKKIEDSMLGNAIDGDITSVYDDLFKLQAIYEQRVEAGYLTKDQATELLRKSQVGMRNGLFIKSVREYTEKGDFIGAWAFTQETKKDIPVDYTMDEHNNLIGAMIYDINESVRINEALETTNEETIKAKKKEMVNQDAIDIFSGKMTVPELQRRVAEGKYGRTDTEALMNIINKQGRGTNDWLLIGSIQEDIRNRKDPDMIRGSILLNSGSNLTEKKALELMDELNVSLDQQSILNTRNVRNARDYIEQSMKLSGRFVRDADKERYAMTIREFNDRVLKGEDPWDVADELYIKDSFEKTPNPSVGEKKFAKDDLDNAEKAIKKAVDDGDMDRETFNYQMEIIERLRSIKQNMDSFEKAKKDARSKNR